MTAIDNPILEVRGLDVTLGQRSKATKILNGIDLTLQRGSTVALVGESGSGKSTIAKTVIGIHRADRGSIRFAGTELVGASRRTRRSVRRRIQLVPQNPYSSLDPRRTIGQTLAEAIDPVLARVGPNRERISSLLAMVALDDSAITRYPHEFSGGQRQRIAIARALATDPEVVIADEITSALDVSTQAEILDLLARLRQELQLTVLFISHNLAVVSQICDDIVVLLGGDVVESGSVQQVFADPQSEYTRTLIDSVPGGPAFGLALAAPAPLGYPSHSTGGTA
ncbi:ABC transporter ATP-binding protein [Rhodococcus fascians]|uniref:ABC transporter ATP-binding protein n=1 Tax=Rhodococcoides fascians TaxID=1828 RepID=UPI001427D6C5|nr:ABC transporter ATP-binding protein [Rhodococcus fascians]MBM7244309.1 ABC transporter ATP-binding protein [Rhodococcus fascians]MBY3810334.1 ABC transporter ATP-binding protein [Rhodococcus fascians]MBY3842043.1 ABC transporter ATP-binding protein [Rhodococcus fascians]MBY3844494.1 ABC transporter ATP-binding protein [Rhodococcus fascians]MBY3850440.1 ABC transporter ATP-binding protein [Rhodococcus fascians]